MGSPLAKAPGAYAIIHNPTGRFYVGSTQNLQERFHVHRNSLVNGTHYNAKLQEVFTSLDDISIEIAVASSVEEARRGEQTLLDKYWHDPDCCNVAVNAIPGWTPGNVPEHIIEKNRQRSIGNQYAKGHVVSDEAREAVRQANTGLKRSPETLDRMSSAKDHLKRPVLIDGVRYAGVRDAAIALGIPLGTARARLDATSPKFAQWKFV
jgi:predicted GIY-YIG superfamily endonuclease